MAPRSRRVTELCGKYRISEAVFDKCGPMYGVLEVTVAKWGRSVELENVKLKCLLVAARLDGSTLREMLGRTSDARDEERCRGLTDEENRVLIRGAAGLGGMDARVHRYRSTRRDCGTLRQRLRELSVVRRRCGYRCFYVLLLRNGIVVYGN